MMYIHFYEIDWNYLNNRTQEERTYSELNKFKKVAEEKIEKNI